MSVLRRTLPSVIVIIFTLPLSPATFAENAAEVVYVTDELRLGVYAGELTTGTPFKTVLSGAKLVVLEHSLRSLLVRTEGGDEGWVKSGYTVTVEPARRRIVALEEDNANLQLSLSGIETTAATAAERIADLESQLREFNDAMPALRQFEEANTLLRTQLDGRRVAWHWLVLSIFVALAGGWGMGHFWLARRVSKKFGGLRVY